MALHWDGTSWSVSATEPIGDSSTFWGVSATGADDVWGVGTYYDGTAWHTLAEHWDGSAWLIAPTPDVGGNPTPLGLSSLAGVQVAVGYGFREPPLSQSPNSAADKQLTATGTTAPPQQFTALPSDEPTEHRVALVRL